MEQLARLRELKGFSQRALAKESGVSPATIYELENGRRRPNPSTLRKLASALDVEVADLLGADYPKAPRRSSLEPSLFNGLEEEQREPTFPEPPSEDPMIGHRWVPFGLGYVQDYKGMTDEDLEEIRSKAEEIRSKAEAELKRRSHA
jgi:transcriptional regulator with XRE-family HTH domain